MGKKKEDDETEDAGGGKKKIGMAVGGVVLLGAVYNFVLKPAPEAPPETMAMMEEPEPIEGEIYELPEMVINLEGDEATYVRFAAALVLEEGTLAADFEAESAIARDIIHEIVSSKTADELRGDNRQLLKDEISMKVREAYDDAKVVRALIVVLVTQ